MSLGGIHRKKATRPTFTKVACVRGDAGLRLKNTARGGNVWTSCAQRIVSAQ